MRKTALLSGVAGLLLVSAPAFAQDGTAPQTPPATPPAEAPQAQPAPAPTLSLTPGATVRGSDGDLGVLVGARMNGGRQQLTVRGEDGTVRAVPIDGIRQEGDVVVVDFTVEQFGTAEAVAQPAMPAEPAEPGLTPATPATPATPPAVPATPPMTPPVTPDQPADPADEANAAPTEGSVSPPPTLPSETPASPATPPSPATPATPVPGEGADQDPNQPGA